MRKKEAKNRERGMIGMDEKALQYNVPWISKMKGNICENEWNKSAKKLAKTKL